MRRHGGEAWEDDLNDARQFSRLNSVEQAALLLWIRLACRRATTADRNTSYGMKHDFEADGFYVVNGAFKGAMQFEGYEPTRRTEHEINWVFNVRPTQPRARRDRHVIDSTGRYGLEGVEPSQWAEFVRLVDLAEQSRRADPAPRRWAYIFTGQPWQGGGVQFWSTTVEAVDEQEAHQMGEDLREAAAEALPPLFRTFNAFSVNLNLWSRLLKVRAYHHRLNEPVLRGVYVPMRGTHVREVLSGQTLCGIACQDGQRAQDSTDCPQCVATLQGLPLQIFGPDRPSAPSQEVLRVPGDVRLRVVSGGG